MTQKLRALTTFPVDRGWISSTHMLVNNLSKVPVPEDPTLFWLLQV